MLSCRVTANAAGSNSVITFRKNGSNGNQSITIGAGATGGFVDSTNTDSISSGDRIAAFIDRGGGSVTVLWVGVYYECNEGFFSRVGAAGSVSFSTASVTRYLTLCGDSALGTTEDGTRAHRIATTCTAKNLNLTITSNARSSSTTYKLRKNNADTSLSITVGASSTGRFEDNSNTASFADGDTANYSMTTGTGGGAIVLSRISVALEFVNRSIQYFQALTTGANNVSAASRFSGISGSCIQTGGESSVKIPLYGSGTIRKMYLFIISNGASVSTTTVMRLNGADTAVTRSVAAGGTGEFSDTTNSFSFSDGDNIAIRTIKSATSTVSFGRFSFVADYNSEFTPQISSY